MLIYNIVFFFKQKTAYEIKECDWSSDVCSSDLEAFNRVGVSYNIITTVDEAIKLIT